MDILVLDDERTIAGRNQSEMLCKLLKQAGHSSMLFEGRDKGLRVSDPIRSAELIQRDIAATFTGRDAGFVLDIQWFNARDYGIRLLKALYANKTVTPAWHSVVYSHHIGEWWGDLTQELKIPPKSIFSRNTTRVERIVEQFSRSLSKQSDETHDHGAVRPLGVPQLSRVTADRAARGNYDVEVTENASPCREELAAINAGLVLADHEALSQLVARNELERFHGKYIAFCEGRIWWSSSDPDELRRQTAEFLQKDEARIVIHFVE